ncbi:MAG: proteasome accessory factor PafA2 family protein [Microthrixaceae bacterium]
MSQRAEHIWEGFPRPRRDPPDHQHRDEPRSSDRYRRLHVIRWRLQHERVRHLPEGGCCRPRAPGCSRTAMVLRDMTLENPIRAIREISHDLTLAAPVKLANGRELTALEIQSEYLERALRYAQNHELSPQEAGVTMWEHVMVGLQTDPMSLHREIDWVTKYQLIEAYMARHDLELADPRVALVDLQYHDIRRSRSVFYKLRARAASNGS